MPNITIVLKYTDHDAITAELQSFGLDKNVESDNVLSQWPYIRSSDCVDAVTGDIYCSTRLDPETVDSILANNPVTFEVVWRSDDFSYSGLVDVISYINHEAVWDYTDPASPVLLQAGYRETVITPTYMENVQHPWPTYQAEDPENHGSFIAKSVGGIA